MTDKQKYRTNVDAGAVVELTAEQAERKNRSLGYVGFVPVKAAKSTSTEDKTSANPQTDTSAATGKDAN